jgi:hypothetical protein|uniref:Uncharacterized protein n=1 Tax=Oryza sativa subsp. japonica TaxID=39947 RepID=Q2R462_ORYSJ|nr:hypothetical protein LOC_Os11g29580 [Oryza sativa Japonica Group]
MPEEEMATSAGARARRKGLPEATLTTRRMERPARRSAVSRRRRAAVGVEGDAVEPGKEKMTTAAAPIRNSSWPEAVEWWRHH